MKKTSIITIVLLAFTIIGTTIYAIDHPKVHQIVKSTFMIKTEEKRLFDWLHYDTFISNQHQPQLENMFDKELGSKEMLLAIVRNAPKIIEANNKNIHRLEKIEFKTNEFQEIQKLDIEALKIQNQLMQENIIDHYAKHKTTQSYLQAPALNLQAKSQYLLQQMEIKNLNYLQILAIKKDPRLKTINADELHDWMLLQNFTHERNPKEPTWDTIKILKKMSARTALDEKIELNAYKYLNFKTDLYRIIQQLNIELIQKNINYFSNYTHPNVSNPPSSEAVLTLLKTLQELAKDIEVPKENDLSTQLTKIEYYANKKTLEQIKANFL